jgi:protein phosphatase
VVGVWRDRLYLAQIGDSRGYLVRAGEAWQLTRDQSLTQRLVEVGELTEEEAEASERRNIILQALGPDPRIKVDLSWQMLQRGDVLIICSDGLSGMVRREDLAATVSDDTGVDTIAHRLVDLANERGGPDNITVIVVRVDGDGLRAADGADPIGHQVYPLIDTEASTDPVPVYKGSPPPVSTRQGRWRMIGLLAAVLAALALLLLLQDK